MESKDKDHRIRNKILTIISLTSLYIFIILIFFYLFTKSGIDPTISGVLSLFGGIFIVFIFLVINDSLKDFSIKSPLLELTSTLKERIEYVKEDLVESKKEINDKISGLNQNIQSIISTLNNTNYSTSQAKGESRSYSTNSTQNINNLGDVMKEVRQLTMDMITLKIKESGFRLTQDSENQINSLLKKSDNLQFKISDDLVKVENDIQVQIDMGLMKNLSGKYHEAIEIYDTILNIYPENVAVIANKVDSLNNLGRYEEALAWVNKALKIDPECVACLINKGNALLLQSKFEESIKLYDYALMIDPSLSIAYNNKAKALLSLGKREEALQSVEKAIEINPSLSARWNI